MNAIIIDSNDESRNTMLRALKLQPFKKVQAVADFDEGQRCLADAPCSVAFVSLDDYEEIPDDVFDPLFEEESMIRVVGYAKRAEIQDAVEAMRIGAIDFVSIPFSEQRITTVCAKILAKMRQQEHSQMLEVEQKEQNMPIDFSSEDASMKEVLDVAARVAPTDATVLLLGESGTGKSVLAKAIHANSNRAEMKFTTVHCPSLSQELLESTLFGHIKGAFTGAVKDQWGCVASGDGGTLFLDEIGELPLEIQPKLLQLLQEKSYQRIGETKLRHADVRIISATNRNLEEEIAKGTFREDLYYRLNVIAIHAPPIRERPKDLLRIAESMLIHFSRIMGKTLGGLDASAQFAIQNHQWPGNLRELRNTLERAVILSKHTTISTQDLGLTDELEHLGLNSLIHDRPTVKELELHYIEQIVSESETLGEAAEILGVNPSTLYRKRQQV